MPLFGGAHKKEGAMNNYEFWKLIFGIGMFVFGFGLASGLGGKNDEEKK